MQIKIKTWEKMEKEFGLDDIGSIDCEMSFSEMMENTLPKDRIITVRKVEAIQGEYTWNYEADSKWYFNHEMIEKIVQDDNDIQYVMIKYEDGLYPLLAKTNIPSNQFESIEQMYETDGLDMAMKLTRFAEKNNLFFEEIEFETIEL